ncbi:MAG TPA: hypothetical protein VNS32_21370, partial [Flavisolibacter sp.]|nr:hypothetical protein [Flavisolibacter sp.]
MLKQKNRQNSFLKPKEIIYRTRNIETKMNNTNTYGTIINEKLNEFSFPDMNSTWPEMKAILDREMPEKRRRGFLFWNNISSMTAFIIGSSLVYLAVHYYNKNHTTQATQNNTVTSFNKITKSTDFKTASPITTNTVFANEKYENHKSGNRVSNNQKLSTVISGPANNKQAKTESSTSSKPGSLSTVQSFEKKSMNSKELPKQPAVEETVFSMAVNRTDNFKEQSKNIGKEDIVKEDSRNIASLQTNTLVKSVSVNKTTDSLIKETTTGIAEKANFTNPIIDSVQTKSLPVNDTLSSKKTKPSTKDKGWVAGASINYNLPVSSQEMSTVNMNGKKNTLIDFLPSIYVQYHFNRRWHLESSFQFSSPQYISSQKLASE